MPLFPTATTEFWPLETTDLGFDFFPDGTTAPNEHWQMVPVGGARGVKLIKGRDLDLSISPASGTSVATFNQVSGLGADEREIWISGHSPGSAFLEARDRSTGQIKVRLQILVKPLQKLTWSFFCVQDQASRKTTYNCSRLKSIIDGAALIWERQANTKLILLHCRENYEIQADLGDIVNSATAFPLMDPSTYEAHLNIFVVWEVQNPKKPGEDMNAVTCYDRCIFEDNIDDPVTALAHEVGHYFDLPHETNDSSNLMYPAGGQLLSKTQVVKAQNWLNKQRIKKSPKGYSEC